MKNSGQVYLSLTIFPAESHLHIWVLVSRLHPNKPNQVPPPPPPTPRHGITLRCLWWTTTTTMYMYIPVEPGLSWWAEGQCCTSYTAAHIAQAPGVEGHLVRSWWLASASHTLTVSKMEARKEEWMKCSIKHCLCSINKIKNADQVVCKLFHDNLLEEFWVIIWSDYTKNFPRDA